MFLMEFLLADDSTSSTPAKKHNMEHAHKTHIEKSNKMRSIQISLYGSMRSATVHNRSPVRRHRPLTLPTPPSVLHRHQFDSDSDSAAPVLNGFGRRRCRRKRPRRSTRSHRPNCCRPAVQRLCWCCTEKRTSECIHFSRLSQPKLLHIVGVQLSFQRRQIQIAPVVRVVQPNHNDGQQCDDQTPNEEHLQHEIAAAVDNHAGHHRDDSQTQILHRLATGERTILYS